MLALLRLLLKVNIHTYSVTYPVMLKIFPQQPPRYCPAQKYIAIALMECWHGKNVPNY
jgi:hypothetical protein